MSAHVTPSHTPASPAPKQKTIARTPLTSETKASFEASIHLLKEVYGDAQQKAAAIQNKTESILSIYKELSELKVINPSEQFEGIVLTSFKEYFSLVSFYADEIKSRLELSHSYLNDSTEEVAVDAAEDDSFEEFMKSAIKYTARYVKTHKKHLSILFSRYDHGIELHLRHFKNLKASLKQKQTHSHPHKQH